MSWLTYNHNADRDNPGDCFIKPDFRVDVPDSWTTLQASCDDAEFVSPDGVARLQVRIRPARYYADSSETLFLALGRSWREPFEYQAGEVTITAEPQSVEVIEQRGKKALYQTRLDTSANPETRCDMAVQRLLVPTQLEQRLPPPAITMTLARCVENAEYEDILNRMLDSFQAFRTQQ